MSGYPMQCYDKDDNVGICRKEWKFSKDGLSAMATVADQPSRQPSTERSFHPGSRLAFRAEADWMLAVVHRTRGCCSPWRGELLQDLCDTLFIVRRLSRPKGGWEANHL